METWLVDIGLPALFAVSFLAATILPIGSEWLLVALTVQDQDPLMLVGVATMGNTLGAITTWAIGVWGGGVILHRWLRIDEAAVGRAKSWYARWGSWSLLMAWAPIVGDPLCLVGGILGVPLWRFTILAGCGKACRYALVAWAAQTLAM